MAQPLLGSCHVVRNEEKNLPRCLASIRDAVDEIIVVDTGSTDRTIAIAKEFGAIVHQEPWRADFSYHRNTALNLCTAKWPFMMDGDEEVVETDFKETRARLSEDRGLADILLVTLIAKYPRGRTLPILVPRLLRASANIRYHFAIHEQLDVLDVPAAPSNITILHHGYEHAQDLVAKEQRNLAIAEAMEPRGVHALHCIVRSAFYLGQWRKAVSTAFQLLEECRNPALIEEACALGAAAAMNAKDTGAVAYLTSYGLGVASHNQDLHLMAAIASVGKYLHTLKDGDSSDPRASLRPSVFWHDAPHVRSVLQSLLGAASATAEAPARTMNIAGDALKGATA